MGRQKKEEKEVKEPIVDNTPEELENEDRQDEDNATEPTSPTADDVAEENDTVTVRVLDCYIGNKGPGEEAELSEEKADYYESIGYVEIIN